MMHVAEEACEMVVCRDGKNNEKGREGDDDSKLYCVVSR
jgi:hypothetical protein